MSIKPGKHVDSSGRIYLPYLHEWTPHHSDLMGMISILTIVFGEESPVFSKGSGAAPATSTPYPIGTKEFLFKVFLFKIFLFRWICGCTNADKPISH